MNETRWGWTFAGLFVLAASAVYPPGSYVPYTTIAQGYTWLWNIDTVNWGKLLLEWLVLGAAYAFVMAVSRTVPEIPGQQASQYRRV